jgi:pyruvate/2-oxoglutarate dehydrogenase complex dihydrolipoamide dehydrogenase (E3) component
MTATEDFDLLVIGGGKAGKTLAMDWARQGRRVAMVERGMIGGTCINVACIPTKALVESARAMRVFAKAERLGLVANPPHVDLDRLRDHKQDVVDAMVAINHKQFTESGMDLVLGQARFVAERTVEVTLNDGGTRVLRGAETVINTGTAPVVPNLPGLTQTGYLTSETLLRLKEIPRRLVVIGAGPIGLEMADMLTAFGSEVTVVTAEDRLLPLEDPDIAEAVESSLTGNGVRLRTAARAASTHRGPSGVVTLTLEDGTSVDGDAVLVAVGRRPVTGELDLARAGVRVTGAGYVDVDEYLATSAPHTWAAGDVAGSPQFTHVSLDDYRILKANLGGGRRSTRGRLIPRTTFLSFEFARVGLTEAQAREAGHDVLVARLPVAAIPRARTARNTEGLWKAVIDADTQAILGVALVGPEAGETVTTVQTAMIAGLPYTALRDMIISHPTMTEGLNLLFGQVPAR